LILSDKAPSSVPQTKKMVTKISKSNPSKPAEVSKNCVFDKFYSILAFS